MGANLLVDFAKRVLPAPLRSVLRRIRTPRQPLDPRIAALRKRHLSYQPADRNEITLRPGITLRIHSESRDPFEWFCFRSPEMTRELDRFIENVGAHSSFVDVGANHGIFSLVFCALRPHGRVLAIDPSPIAFQILQTNLRLNSFASARARKIACGATAGEARMQRNWHHLEATFEASVTNPISVPVLPLDHICEEENIMPELVKIDVEGFELPVLQGAERVLRAANLLFFEVHPDAIHQLSLSQSSIFDLLASGRWRCYRLAEEDPMTRGDFIAQRNIFHTIWRRESF